MLGQEPVVPLCVLRARAIGVITMRDEMREDDKIVAERVIRDAARAYRARFGSVRGPVMERTEGAVMNIELTAEEFDVLRESMELYLTDLRREVAGTENPDMRHRLQRKQNVLEGIVSTFGRTAAA